MTTVLKMVREQKTLVTTVVDNVLEKKKQFCQKSRDSRVRRSTNLPFSKEILTKVIFVNVTISYFRYRKSSTNEGKNIFMATTKLPKRI